PKDKLEGVRTKLANDAAAEQLAAEQLLAEKLEADYTKLMDEGLAKEANGDVNGAISNYEGALELKPNEQLPKGKIQALRNQIANQEDVNLQYREAIDNGDQSMGSEDYQNAITLYNQAIALRPSEQEAKDKLKLAQDAEEERGGAKAQYDKILSAAQENIDSENITKAEELIGRAEVIDPADTRPAGLREQVKVIRLAQAKYQENMNLGEAQASSKNYQEAIGFFELAKKDRPSENEPSSRILEMNRLIGVASSVDQREKLYQDNMAKGLATETGARFPEALSHYQNALSIKPGDQPATDKISEIQQILDDIANANSGEIEKKNKFDAIIIEANEFFAQKNYVGDGTTVAAKEKYEEALTLYPSNSYALTQRDECVRLAVEGVNSEVEAQYAKLLKVADKKFDKLDYDKAKELYTRAVGLKEADPYPKKKLAEIDAILNPLIAESVELKDLGIPIDATIEDGGFILAQDEAKRSLIKKTRIQRKADKAYASQQEMTALKTTDRLATRNEIVRVLNLISVDGMDSDDNRLALIEALRIAEKELNLEEQKNNQFERSDNLATQETLYSIAEDVSLQQTSDANSRKENAIDLKKIQVALAEENTILSGQYVATSYEQDARITNYVQLAIDEVQDDYDERLEIEAELNRALDQAYQVKLDLGNQRTDATLNQQDELDGVRAAVSTKIAEDAQVAGNNNEELKGIRSDVAATADNFQSENLEHSYQTNAEIAEVNRLVIADNQGFEKIRVEASERLKVIKTDKLDADRMAYNGEVEKHLSSQAAINSELEKRKDIQIIADEAMVQKVANAELMSEKARSSSSQAEMTDEVARQNVVQSVNLISMRMKEKEIADAQKVKDNAKLLNDARKTRGSQAAISQEEAKEKALANQQAIHNVDNSPQAKPRIKNALGEEYPEGVSQESFKNVDNEGLMKSIITRRVVVIEGHADVYVRTQTLYGITYSKNSNPSLSNVWNSETQGPDLVRHY
ncbi:MAG: epidermal growth factor receptor substrate 15, partial [Flavobacteriaceae bacterium]